MFHCNGFITIFLIVFAIVLSVHYCELKETTVLKRIVPDNELKKYTNRTYTNCKSSLNLINKKQKRRPVLNVLAKEINQKFNDQILQQKLQLLKDQTKKSVLQLQNLYLENFHINEPKIKYQTSMIPDYRKNKVRLRKRRRNTSPYASKNNNQISRIQNFRKNIFKLRKSRKNSPPCENMGESTINDTRINDTTKNDAKTYNELFSEMIKGLNEMRDSSYGEKIRKHLCQLNGTWVSDSIGVGFNINFDGNSIPGAHVTEEVPKVVKRLNVVPASKNMKRVKFAPTDGIQTTCIPVEDGKMAPVVAVEAGPKEVKMTTVATAEAGFKDVKMKTVAAAKAGPKDVKMPAAAESKDVKMPAAAEAGCKDVKITTAATAQAGPKDVKITICAAKSIANSNHPQVLNSSWNIAGQIPFPSKAMLIITAEYPPDNNVAVFVGQCRCCDGSEVVIGQWIMQKYAPSCDTIEEVQECFGDVLRRQPKTTP